MPATFNSLISLFASLAPGSKVVLAVSGGVDSMALMHLFHAFLGSSAARVDAVVVTVHHGLRPEAATEAATVAREAAALGLRHVTLTWHGPKPASGIQAAARAARYALIETFMTSEGYDTLLTAHTRDDQAETVWMRLKRGTGIVGLAGMRRTRRLANGATHIRPLLDIAKVDLIAYMRATNRVWLEDPSNRNANFERVRIRNLQSEFDTLGISHDNLARTAGRASQYVRYLDAALAKKIASAGSRFQFDVLGYAALEHAWFEGLEPLEQTHLLAACLEAVSGHAEPLPLGQLEDILDAASDREGRIKLSAAPKSRRGFTLHGAEVDVSDKLIRIYREALDARAPLAELEPALAARPLGPGQTIVWDNRFTITLNAAAPHAVTVGPLTESGLAELDARGWPRLPVPARVLWTLPACRRDGVIVALPHAPIPGATIPRHHISVMPHRLPFDAPD